MVRSKCTCKDHDGDVGWSLRMIRVVCLGPARMVCTCPCRETLVGEARVFRSLCLAVQQGRSRDVRSIIQQNPSVMRSETLDSVLLKAINRGMFCLVEWMVENGASVRVLRDAFVSAASRDDHVSVTRMLDIGVQVDSSNSQGATALHAAAGAKAVATVKLLLERGADPSSTDGHGRTPAFNAVKVRCVTALRVLSRFGARLDCVDNGGTTLVMEAMKLDLMRWTSEAVATVEFLRENTPGFNDVVVKVDRNGNGCLHHFARNPNNSASEVVVALCVMNLIDAGAPLNLPNVDGMTPLRISVHRGDWDAARSLLAAGADPDARAPDGSTPLHAAVGSGHSRLVSLLLEFDADVDAETSDGVTPFHLALYCPVKQPRGTFDSIDIFRLMLSGADVFRSAGYKPNPLAAATGSSTFRYSEIAGAILPVVLYAVHCDPSSTSRDILTRHDDVSHETILKKVFLFLCLTELLEMRRERVGNVSFHDLLTCSKDRLLKLIRNPEIDSALRRGRYRKFPMYGHLVEWKYMKVIERVGLLKIGSQFFYRLLERNHGIRLPEECVDSIVNRLSNAQLRSIECVLLGYCNVSKTKRRDDSNIFARVISDRLSSISIASLFV